jgi:hypothetical protein
MKSQSTILIFTIITTSTIGFSPILISKAPVRGTIIVKGYLDDIAKYTYDPEADVQEDDDSREATNMPKEQIDRYGPGDLRQFVDFHEFDGGDGRKFLL